MMIWSCTEVMVETVDLTNCEERCIQSLEINQCVKPEEVEACMVYFHVYIQTHFVPTPSWCHLS